MRGLTVERMPAPGTHALEVVMSRNGDPIAVPRLSLSRIVGGPPPLREYVLPGA